MLKGWRPSIHFSSFYSNYFAVNTRVPGWSELLWAVGQGVFPHLPGEGCQILSELFFSSSSSASYPPRPPPSPPPVSPRPCLHQLPPQLPPCQLLATLCANCPAQCAPLDLNLGPSELSVHCWTSTWDLPSSVCTAGPQPGTFRAQCAPLDLNLGPSQLSVHCWTSTAR